MADLVSQIFQQVPRPTNSGLGQFYAQGVAAGQRNRQLDLQERQARLQDLATGFQMRQYEAEQEIALAQADAETQMGELMSNIYSNPNGFNDPVLINLGFGLMSRLPSNSKLGPQFLEGITNARKLQQARSTMEENERRSAEAAEKFGLPPTRVSGGETTFSIPPQEKQTSLRLNPETGEFEMTESFGNQLTTANLTRLQQATDDAVETAVLASELMRNSNIWTIGPLGYFSRGAVRVGLTGAGAETDLAVDQVRFLSKMVKALKSDGNIAKDERNQLVEEFDRDFFDTAERFDRAVGRTARLIIESQKRRLQSSGLQIPDNLKVENLPWNLLTPNEFLVRTKITDPNAPGYLPFNNPVEIQEAYKSLVFDPDVPLPLVGNK